MLKPLRDMVAELCARDTREGRIAGEAVEAIRALYDSPGGQSILGLLCMVAHPFSPRVRENPQDTAAADGRAEVVCLLLEIGGRGAIALPVLHQTEPTH